MRKVLQQRYKHLSRVHETGTGHLCGVSGASSGSSSAVLGGLKVALCHGRSPPQETSETLVACTTLFKQTHAHDMEPIQPVADSGGMSLLALSSEEFGERLQGRRELCVGEVCEVGELCQLGRLEESGLEDLSSSVFYRENTCAQGLRESQKAVGTQ